MQNKTESRRLEENLSGSLLQPSSGVHFSSTTGAFQGFFYNAHNELLAGSPRLRVGDGGSGAAWRHRRGLQR